MEFKDVVFGRRSIRKYIDKPIKDNDLQYIIDAGLYAPSGVNFQPWYFVVIKSREQMDRLVGVMGNVSDNLTESINERFSNHPEVADETLKFIRKLGGAPVCILAFWHKPEYPGRELGVSQSISAAIENMLLAATDRGLGSCWLTAPLEAEKGDKIRDMFAPGKGEMVAMVTIGYPAVILKAPKRKNGRYVIV